MSELEKLKAEGWIEHEAKEFDENGNINEHPKWFHLFKIDGKIMRFKSIPKLLECDTIFSITLPFK